VSSQIEKTATVIGVMITVMVSVVGIVQYRMDALDDKIVVHVESLQLEITRAREWIGKVSERDMKSAREAEITRGYVNAVNTRLDRMEYILNELREEKKRGD